MGSLFAIAIFFSFAVYVLYLSSSTFKDGSNILESELNSLKTEIEQKNLELIPISREELEIASANLANYNYKKGFRYDSFTGTLVTIYHEPLLVFTGKLFKSTSSKVAIIYAKNINFDFALKITSRDIEVMSNNKFIGNIYSNYTFTDVNNKPFAKIEKKYNDYSFNILNNQLASLNSESLDTTSNLTRAFQSLNATLSASEAEWLTLMLFYFLFDNKNHI
ncbi:MAG: hypothetical protein KBA06_01425 [Saprospiraceae bacterium]|nr:hypothetical protein [Saprospiraceae bacterium]